MKCQTCGREIQDDSKFCEFCGSAVNRTLINEKTDITSTDSTVKTKNTKHVLLKVVLGVLAFGLLIYGGIMTTLFQEKNNEVSALYNTIAENEKTISSLQNSNKYLKTKADNYDIIVSGVRVGSNGYASSHFNVDTPVLLVNKGVTKEVRLTAHWYSGGTVTYTSNNSSIARLEYANNTWSTSVVLKVTGLKEGVSNYTFRNDQDSETFHMIVIVE